MGDALNSMCKPLSTCQVPIVLEPNDLYYDPAFSGKIMQVRESGASNVHSTLNDGDTIFNEATGLTYQFSALNGFTIHDFGQPNSTYVISGDINVNVIMPEHCTLRFQGGKLSGSLTGNLTTIEAEATSIFDTNIVLNGTFTNVYAYPEWWGAINTEARDGNYDLSDCSDAINAAFDSNFGVIRFKTGFYYIADSVVLRKVKTIVMQGEGLTYALSGQMSPPSTTVIWTDQDIDAFVINIDDYKHGCPIQDNWHQRLCIKGGAIDASRCSSFSHSAMVFCLTLNSYRNAVISISLQGPKNDSICYVPNSGGSTGQPRQLAYGTGFEIRDVGSVSQMTGSLFTTELTLHISSFGIGFSTVSVDGMMRKYANPQGQQTNTVLIEGTAVTSLILHGVIDGCTCFIKSPYRCFEGGVIDTTLQVRKDRITDYDEGLIIGDFKDCYINSKIWDAFGKRIFNLLKGPDYNRNLRFGPNTMQYLSSIYDDIDTHLLSQAASQGCSMLRGEMGHHDLNAMGAVISHLGYRDYIHIIDNDLLSIDKVLEGINVNVSYSGSQLPLVPIDPTSPWSMQSPQYSNSPFDLGGMKFYNLISGMHLQIEISFPSQGAFAYRFFNCIIVHLRNSVYNYFNNLTITINASDSRSEIMFNGSYHDITSADEQSEIIIPLRPRKSTGQEDSPIQFLLTSIVFNFSEFVTRSNIWGDEQFGLFIEGRLNRPVSYPVFTSSGGSIGGSIDKRGKPYIFGTALYNQLSDLPQGSAVADGAIAVVSGNPVIKTPQGWKFQQLTGSTASLSELNANYLSAGQSAFNTTLGRPVWWNGSSWVDANGSQISPD